MSEDWIETDMRLMDNFYEEFEQSDEYFEAFHKWLIDRFPEEYGND